ncbi:MAG: P-loop NTPase [Nitrososphaerota archaeon]
MKGVAVVSGKGGTGKTLISVNVALTLLSRGHTVALLDADFSNPNTARMLGLDALNLQPSFTPDHRVIPFRFDDTLPNFEYFSIEPLAKDYGVGKSGAEYGSIVRELIEMAAWRSHYMVVDAPAGYYDTHKSIIEAFGDNYIGSIVVAQPAHPNDLRRVLDLHRINDIPVVGVIENMSSFTCPSCSTEHKIFGESQTASICGEYGVEFLGSIPLSMEVRKAIEMRAPILGEGLRDPIDRAVERIETMKPRRAGFLKEVVERVDERVSQVLISTLVKLLVFINERVPIGRLQAQYNFPGGRIIRLNLLDRSMRRPLVTLDFVVRDGKIKVVQRENVEPDVQIDMYYRALAWALLGEKKTDSGAVVPYDFWRAVWNDDIRIYGYKSYEQMRSWYFLQHVLSEAMRTGGDYVQSLLRVIA